MPTARPRLILKRHVRPPQGRTSMKRALIIAAGCALLAGPASAQSSPPGPDRDGDRVDSRDMRDIRGDRDRRGDWIRGDWDDGPRGRGGDWHGGWGHHGGHQRGAGFLLQSGDTRLAVRCDQNESMRACVDAATTLLDRVRSLPSAGAGTTSPATPGAGTPATPPTNSSPGSAATPPAGSGAGAPAPRPTPR